MWSVATEQSTVGHAVGESSVQVSACYFYLKAFVQVLGATVAAGCPSFPGRSVCLSVVSLMAPD